MVSAIIDTDWAIMCLRGVDVVRRKLNELRSSGLGISAISIGELYEGVYRATHPLIAEQQLLTFLSGVTAKFPYVRTTWTIFSESPAYKFSLSLISLLSTRTSAPPSDPPGMRGGREGSRLAKLRPPERSLRT